MQLILLFIETTNQYNRYDRQPYHVSFNQSINDDTCTRPSGDLMDAKKIGFVLAFAYNSGIGLFSKGFSNSLGDIDPLFSSNGCIAIQLWGFAYLAIANHYSLVPALALVYALEKLFYAQHWIFWMIEYGHTLPNLIQSDPITGVFYAIYGAGDIGFMVFFAWIAWTFRTNFKSK